MSENRPAEWLTPISANVRESRPLGEGQVRESHWSFFESEVLPVMKRMLREQLPHEIADFLVLRLGNSQRFRASELLFALMADREALSGQDAVWASASVEFVQLSRLVVDDLLDDHTQRWGMPTLWVAFDDRKAAALVADALSALAVLAAVEAGTTSDATPDPAWLAETVAEHSRRMTQGMHQEISHQNSTLSRAAYDKIASLKACNGSLCVDLLRGLSPHDDGFERPRLLRALALTDIAAAIANDYSELHGIRGLDGPRNVNGEPRGTVNEIALGRPTIFQVYVETDEMVRAMGGNGHHLRQAEGLWTESAATLFEYLERGGALAWARQEKDRLVSAALTQIPNSMVQTRKWIGSTAPTYKRDGTEA